MAKMKNSNKSGFRKLHKGNRKKGSVNRDLNDIERLKEELLKK